MPPAAGTLPRTPPREIISLGPLNWVEKHPTNNLRWLCISAAQVNRMSRNSQTPFRDTKQEASERTRLQQPEHSPSVSLYDPSREHDACGVGFVARIDAVPSHTVIDDALAALGCMAHRGGSGQGFETVDGAGILLPVPQALMRRVWRPLCGELPEHYGIGHFFLPAEPGGRAPVEARIERTLDGHGLHVLAWRDTPVRIEILREEALDRKPSIRQALVVPKEGCEPEDGHAFERVLYTARRHMEHTVAAEHPECSRDFHAASLSSRSIVYKGMLPGSQLAAFYADLADQECAAHFAVFHERYSTNTQPAWRLAQPFHCLAHNGEINTLACNQVAMRMREPLLESPLFGDSIRHIRPVLDPAGSDSSMLDNAFELLLHGGRSPAHAAMMLLPEPFGQTFVMGEDKRAFYEFHAPLMEPWDGPSALVFTDGGRQVGAMLDRNALRPCRYALTTDGLFILASESGVLDLPPSRIARRGRLYPRRMLLVDFARHRIVTDAECKNTVIHAKPYRHWIREKGVSLRDLPLPQHGLTHGGSDDQTMRPDVQTLEGHLLRQQHLFGFSKEDVADILIPMAKNAQEPVASMGLDTPLAVLSRQPQLLFSYLKQRFAQVTNPPVDPLREGLVMSLTGFAGRHANPLSAETPEHYSLLRLPNPVLNAEDLERLIASRHPHVRTAVIPMLFPLPAGGPHSGGNGESAGKLAGKILERALDALCVQADAALEGGATLLLLSDAGADAANVPIPSLLAVSALHHHLLRQERRHTCGILADTGEAREVMHIAQLIAFGASAVHPRLAYSLIAHMADQGKVGPSVTPLQAQTAYATAVQKGLLKTLSRMGISTLRSFLGGQGFEAVGFGKNIVDRYFTELPSRIGGIGLEEIAFDACRRHASAYPPAQATPGSPASASPATVSPPDLRDTGRHRHRAGGERHLWSPQAIRSLHKAVRENDREAYRAYAEENDDQRGQPVSLRGLLQFAPAVPVPLDEVEPEISLLRRFVGAAMSLGAISPEAHEAIAIAFNRVGARSNCGEGGEATDRLISLPGGDSARSRIRQIASGRFGVTAAYLVQADEIQIKIAQGAKPGEGGQLPAFKVLPEIARLRHTIPGVTLISPPPHHDIYSIEDLAQLIFDLTRLHPGARVSVKLVAGTNIGTVANGVAKAGADSILVSGHDGGTGASPRSAIDHVGLPWELGLAETQAALVHSGLRSRVLLQVDGQLRSGRDLAIAALLGADEFGLGASLLVALGCCMLRVCHLGTCPVGIAAQDPKLRARFPGSPDHVERFLRFLASDLREHMASLGFRTLDGMRGCADLLLPIPLSSLEKPHAGDASAANWQSKIAGLDLSPLLVRTAPLPGTAGNQSGEAVSSWASVDKNIRNPLPESSLDQAMLAALMPGVRAGRPSHFESAVRNTDRSVGTRLSGEVARLHGDGGLTPGMVDVVLAGTAGQSAGAFLMRGITLTIRGDANDYVGKGLSGGIIIIRPENTPGCAGLAPFGRPAFADGRAALGNVALYGATSGALFAAGSAGERFAVRNSGANAIVEGVGDHACEYMTGGVVVVLGPTGYNFAAGMSGGAAFVFDGDEMFQTRCNMDGVDLESVWLPHDVQLLRSLVARHARLTGSPLAAYLLDNWSASLPLFLKITPIEYRQALARMKQSENARAESVAATEEVFHPCR